MKLKSILFFGLFCISLVNYAQVDTVKESNTLRSQYQTLKSTSNNYQIYKVVNEESLDDFWKSIADTLQKNSEQINALDKQVADFNNEVNSLSSKVAARDTSLADQEYQIEHMEFLGVGLTKGTYITLTWFIIFLLLAIALVLYFRFNAAHRITTASKNEYQHLLTEFEAHKQKCRETETKLKRDLQTEINTVVELREQLGEN